jgi:hypothetical protein
MTIDFYIEENRLDECKIFIRSLTTARFNHNPIKVGKKYNINLTLDVEDGNKLSQLFEKWYEEDKPKERPNKNIWKRIVSVFNCL